MREQSRMNTLSELYLGSEPKGVQVQDEKLVIELANGRHINIPLQVASQFAFDDVSSRESLVLILPEPPRIDHVHVSESTLSVYLVDGRVLGCPLAWFPRLVHGTPAERNNYELVGEDDSIHWPDLDEDVELARLFEGGKSSESEGSIQRWLASRQVHVAV